MLTSSTAETGLCRAILPDSLVAHATLTDVVRNLCHDHELGESDINTYGPSTTAAADFIRACRSLDGADATCPFLQKAAQLEWLQCLLHQVRDFPTKFGLFCLTISIPVFADPLANCSLFASSLRRILPSWSCTFAILNSAAHGDGIAALRWSAIAARPRSLQPCYSPMLPTAIADAAAPFGDFIQSDLCSLDSALPRQIPLAPFADLAPDLSPPTVYDPDFPAPEPHCRPNNYSFCLPFSDTLGRNFIREAEPSELLDMYSAPPILVHHLRSYPVDPSDLPWE